jgi:hypothetical protein
VPIGVRQDDDLHRCLAGRLQGDEWGEHPVAPRLHLLLLRGADS